ncbi:MAG TPA: cupredoxin domain-containing protein, partial [Actinomycetota bacterium]
VRRQAVGRTRAMVLAAVAAFSLVACGGDDDGNGGAGSPEPAGNGDAGTGAADITISGLAFNPSTLDVAPGDTISVTNEDGPTHTITADDGSFDEELAPGDSADVTVEGESGTEIPFHCEIHPSMTGTLTLA